jgi:hypothetical protein
MGEPIILYCFTCNPERHHKKDRRQKAPSAEIVQFPGNNRSPIPVQAAYRICVAEYWRKMTVSSLFATPEREMRPCFG